MPDEIVNEFMEKSKIKMKSNMNKSKKFHILL